jgi:hypothetical protein
MRWRDGKFVTFGVVAICVAYVAFLIAEGVLSNKWAAVIAVFVFVAIVLAIKHTNERSQGPQ